MFTKVGKIMSAEEVLSELPLPKNLQIIKETRDKEIKAILDGTSDRLLLIIGPCSADNEDAVCEYVSRLSKIYDKVKEKIMFIPRIYTNKPRTKGEGYKGMYHQPNPEKGTDILGGIIALRKMHIRAISETGLSAADEMLYPDNSAYIHDLLSYVAVGARSAENQQHRLVASGSDIPVGIKNPMNGSLQVLVNSIYASQISNEFNYNDYQVVTEGNPYAHAVLRGQVDNNGINFANYHYEDIIKLSALYESAGLKNPAIIVDTNHSNSGKDPMQQPRIVNEVLFNKHNNPEFGKYIKGFLIESYLQDGSQGASGKEFGKSITDGCLGWEKTERLIYSIADKL